MQGVLCGLWLVARLLPVAGCVGRRVNRPHLPAQARAAGCAGFWRALLVEGSDAAVNLEHSEIRV